MSVKNQAPGLVRTNDRCVGCNKCIGVCSCMGAMTAKTNADGSNVIEVDGDKCIACGACFDACEHDAREFTDDTEAFFKALKRGEKVSILIAPAFLANYPGEYESVLGGLKKLGANRMISVSFGDQLATFTNATASRSNQSQEKIMEALEQIQNDTQKLSDIVVEINVKTENLAASSEEIAASNDMILEATGNVKNSLKELAQVKS